MSDREEKTKPFVVTDRRKFTAEGDARPDAPKREEAPPSPPPTPVESTPEPTPEEEPKLPPPPTAEQSEQVRAAYAATVDRLDTAIRAANPAADHLPPITFLTLVNSIYMSTIYQLGGAAQEGQPPQVDIIGARHSIDMLAVLAEKSKGNLSSEEQGFIDSILFELRMGFLEVTQALSRAAAAKGPNAPPSPPAGPSLIR